MAHYYTLCLNIQDRYCVVVGAGEVAARKAARLVECGARVTVIGRSIDPELIRMRDAGLVRHIDDDYRSEYLDDAFLVIGATDDAAVNEHVHGDAEASKKLVNIVDCPDLCNFIVPALIQRGDLTVAVSTGGRSPALARKIREELEESLDEGYAVLIHLMGRLRARILARGNPPGENRALFESLVESPLINLLNERKWSEAQRLVFELTGENVTLHELLDCESSNNTSSGGA